MENPQLIDQTISNEIIPEPKKTGTPNEGALRQKVVPYAQEILDKLLNLMRNGDNSNVQLGAAKTLFNKILPDLKAMELTGREGQDFQIRVNIVEEKPILKELPAKEVETKS